MAAAVAHHRAAAAPEIIPQCSVIQADGVTGIFKRNTRGSEAEDPVQSLRGGVMLGGIVAQRKLEGVGQKRQHQVLFAVKSLRRVEQSVVAMMRCLLETAALGGLLGSHD